MTDATGSGDAAGAGALTAALDAGRQLEREFLEMFPGQAVYRKLFPHQQPDVTEAWRAAVAHGATLGWAVWAASVNASVTAVATANQVGRALGLASAVPVGVIDALIGYGWTPTGLSDLRYKTGSRRFPEIARRLGALHRAVPGIGGPDGTLLWHAHAAMLSADSAGLTDLQALRWLQVDQMDFASGYFVWLTGSHLQEWVTAAGPDGWVWEAAGFTPAETRRLRALPVGHPDRPGPKQLAVMAALRQT